MSQKIDVSTLPKPINACRWVAAQLRAQVKLLPRNTPAATIRELETRMSWLERLGQAVAFQSDNPVLLLALGALALDVKQREAFMKALQQVDTLTEAAIRGEPVNNGTASPWAEVDP